MRILSAAMLIALFAGCTGENSNCDNGDCTDVENPDCTDNCNPVDEMGTLTVQVTADGASVDTSINDFRNGEHVLLGMTGDVIDLESGSYNICAGPTDKLTEDNLPVIDFDGRMWTSSTIDVSIAPEADEQQSITLNQFVEGTWSCQLANGDDVGSVHSENARVEYGHLLYLPSLHSNMVLSGSEFTYVDEEDRLTQGYFDSATTAVITRFNDVDGTTGYCWFGDENDDPRPN